MTTVLAVSPHLDDAVFSIGALLARHAAAGARVVVLTCFTATIPDPQGFALACQLDKGLGPDIDYMALRRAEDIEACRLLGLEAQHLPLPEAPHRGYGSAPELFGGKHDDDRIGGALAPQLAALIAELDPDLILGPHGLGNHVDHLIVRETLAALGHSFVTWADLPYAARDNFVAPHGKRAPCGELFERKVAACAAYCSQFSFQFGTDAELRRRISIGGDEILYATTPAARSSVTSSPA